MDKMTIPGLPELTMGGVKKQMTIRILEGTRGGFVVIYEDALAARSTWDEVLDSIAEAGVDLLQVERLQMPRHMTRHVPDEDHRSVESLSTRAMFRALKERSLVGLHAIGIVLSSTTTAILGFLSVKVA